MRRTCYYCMDKPARFPIDNPKFCTIRCAARLGVERTMDLGWCKKHGWYDDYCDDCLAEEKERDDGRPA